MYGHQVTADTGEITVPVMGMCLVRIPYLSVLHQRLCSARTMSSIARVPWQLLSLAGVIQRDRS